MTSKWNLTAALVCLLISATATASEPVVMDLWPEGAITDSPVNGPERVGREGSGTGAVRNISHARMEIYRPARPNGTAVVIAGGGGYFRIQIGRGSRPVARWLASAGITAAVLYYRLPGDGWDSVAPIQDGQRAVRLLREHADEFGIDPAQVGILGMSAGGHMAAVAGTRHAVDFYTPVDDADRLPARPDFVVLLYPVTSMRPPLDTTRTRAHMDRAPKVEEDFSPELHVDDTTPPMFLAHSIDDPIAHVDHSRVMYAALEAGGIPTELHLFATGGHSWGLGRPGIEPAAWPRLFTRWARDLGFMQRGTQTASAAGADIEALQEKIEALQLQVSQMNISPGSATSNGATSWRHGGPELRSADGFYRLHLRGRVLFDASSTNGSRYSERNINGTELRSARLGAQGSIGAMRYKVDTDFADQEVSVKDAWIGFNWHAFGMPMELFLGNRLKGRSIEGSGTVSRTPFMERNAVAQVGAAVNGYYGLGAHLKVYGRSWHIGTSIAGDQIDNTGDESDSITYSVRGHWNPIKAGIGFVHLGSWYYYEELADDVTRINNIPRIGQHFNDNLRVSASSIADPKRNEAYGLELGGVYRSVWSLAEWTERRIAAPSADDPGLDDRIDRDAWAVSAGWLITGERPGFSTRSGVWGTTRVLRPVTEGGWGAFELAVRVDRYDYTDAPRGGDGRRTTLGLNWYLNNYARLMLNYVDWKTRNQVGAFQGPDSGNAIGMRAQLRF